MTENPTSKRLFRKVSLERLSSPEQLDQLMRITTPVGWVALAATGLIIICAVVWGIWGSIATKVEGSGILMKRGGVYTIAARAPGRVKNLYFKQGAIVRAGQMVAIIGQPDIVDKIINKKKKIAELEEQYKISRVFSKEDIALEKRSLEQQRVNFEMTNTALEDILRLLEKRLVEQRRLVKFSFL
jgi:HlyD family secretion protein